MKTKIDFSEKLKTKQNRISKMLNSIKMTPDAPNFLVIPKSNLTTQLNNISENDNAIGYQVRFIKPLNSNDYTLQFMVILPGDSGNAANLDFNSYELHIDLETPISDKNVRMVFEDSSYDIFTANQDEIINEYVYFNKEEIIGLPGSVLVFSPAIIDFSNSILLESQTSYCTIKIEAASNYVIGGATEESTSHNEVSRFVLGLPCPPAWKPGAPYQNM